MFSGMIQYNSVFFSNLIKLSNCQSLYMGRGNFGERKIVTDQVGGPPVGLAIGIRGETSPLLIREVSARIALR